MCLVQLYKWFNGVTGTFSSAPGISHHCLWSWPLKVSTLCVFSAPTPSRFNAGVHVVVHRLGWALLPIECLLSPLALGINAANLRLSSPRLEAEGRNRGRDERN